MVKNDSSKRKRGCKTTTGLVQTITAYRQQSHDPTQVRFNFCPTRIFLFFCRPTIGTFGFARPANQRFAKPKEPIFSDTS